jgi:hypothetical protein
MSLHTMQDLMRYGDTPNALAHAAQHAFGRIENNLDISATTSTSSALMSKATFAGDLRIPGV